MIAPKIVYMSSFSLNSKVIWLGILYNLVGHKENCTVKSIYGHSGLQMPLWKEIVPWQDEEALILLDFSSCPSIGSSAKPQKQQQIQIRHINPLTPLFQQQEINITCCEIVTNPHVAQRFKRPHYLQLSKNEKQNILLHITICRIPCDQSESW